MIIKKTTSAGADNHWHISSVSIVKLIAKCLNDIRVALELSCSESGPGPGGFAIVNLICRVTDVEIR